MFDLVHLLHLIDNDFTFLTGMATSQYVCTFGSLVGHHLTQQILFFFQIKQYFQEPKQEQPGEELK